MSSISKEKVVYHIARKREELEQAFSLVYKEYAARGYIPKHYKSTLRLSLYNALPKTTTFLAKQGKRVIATVTLIPDSFLGIPMDKIYKNEVDTLREKGHKVAEASQLSIDNKLFPKGWFSMFNFDKLIFIFKLFKLVLDYTIYFEKINDICIAINPKQQYLYKFLGFKELGGLKYYGTVNRAPAIAKYLNLDSYDQKVKQKMALYKLFYKEKTDPEVFSNKFIFTVKDLEYFFVEKSDIFEKASEKQLEFIENCYSDKRIAKFIDTCKRDRTI